MVSQQNATAFQKLLSTGMLTRHHIIFFFSFGQLYLPVTLFLHLCNYKCNSDFTSQCLACSGGNVTQVFDLNTWHKKNFTLSAGKENHFNEFNTIRRILFPFLVADVKKKTKNKKKILPY